MAEERRDQQQPEADGQQPDDQEAQMEAVTPPDAENVAEEVAARQKLEAEAERSEDAREEATEEPGRPEAEAPASPEARRPDEQPEERPAPEDDREVSEDVSDAGETLAEAPAEWVDEGMDAMEHEASKADKTTRAVEEEEQGRDQPPGPAASAAAARPPGTAQSVRPAAAGPTAAPRPPREHRPSRRTLSREERRRRTERRRARRRTIYMILGGSVAAMLILGLVLGDLGITPPVPEVPPVGQDVGVQPGEIIQPGAEHGGYQHNPPTSGPRYEEPAPWGFHEEQQENEHVVRNLEMGGIVFNHNLTDPTSVENLRDFVEELSGYPGCYVVQPYAGIPEGTVVLTAWGWMQQFTGVDRNAKNQFVVDHRNQRGPLVLGPTCGYTPPAEPTDIPQETPEPEPEEPPAEEPPGEQEEPPAGEG